MDSKNTRLSYIGYGTPGGTLPMPDGAISSTEADGSDMRHLLQLIRTLPSIPIAIISWLFFNDQPVKGSP